MSYLLIDKYACMDTSVPKCPHCKRDYLDWGTDGPDEEVGDGIDVWCSDCDKEYQVTQRVTYTTAPMGGWL